MKKSKEVLEKDYERLSDELDKLWDESFNRPDGWEWYINHPVMKEYEKCSRELRLIDDYTLEDLPSYGHHMSLEEFIECCLDEGFIDNDGSGVYATKDKASDIEICPSDIIAGVYRKDFTHVVWFNK